MSVSTRILSDIVHFMKYAKYLPKKHRRESYNETVDRNMRMHIKRFPFLREEIERAYKFVYDKKCLPSMRSMQFAGKPIVLNNSRIFNCAYLPADHIDAFSEIMFLLLSGTGVGFSVQNHDVEKLPPVCFPRKNLKTGRYKQRKYVIGDSIEGWADAVKILFESYFNGKSDPNFIFDDIRPKGARLVTSGGKAPGPQPLKDCLHNIRKVLDTKSPGSKLSPIEVHDIVCYIADAVLAGGIRRAALISLFSFDDEEMRTAKYGDWTATNPQRMRANNSAVTLRHRVKRADFFGLWEKIQNSRSGEPAIYLSNNQRWGCNPCVEIGLRPFQFCNLTEINASDIEDQEDLEQRCTAAAFIGTLQASYTDFHYLREIWRETTEKDALLGVSMTGIASGRLDSLDLKWAANVVREENKRVAKLIGINTASRLTCVKPAGTTSCILGTSSGVHPWHNDYYLRRLRVSKSEVIYEYLAENHPELVEDDFFKPNTDAIITIPVAAPSGAITRKEDALSFLERVRRISAEWVAPGHITGQNSHNVSATVNIKEGEWDSVGWWMWENKNTFNGLSTFPYDNGVYVQAPHEDCTKEKYEELINSLKSVNLMNIVEYEDQTNLQGELACSGASCTITNL
jgi:ribonucleoside-diphosphate reductase alpha chain